MLLAVFGSSAALFGCGSGETSGADVQSHQVLSPVYSIDGIYRSMMGPQSTRPVKLGDAAKPELLWITGFRTEMVESDGETPAPPEFMCHSNLDWNAKAHRNFFKQEWWVSNRLFTVSQGQLALKFPHGFGIPILSTQALPLNTQVLNLNEPDGDRQVRHKVQIDYVRDRDVTTVMKPLFMKAATSLKTLDGNEGYWSVDKPDTEKHGPGCSVGMQAADDVRKDKFGRKFTGHWVVKPGREVNSTLVTKYLDLPFDTTIHFIAVHVHPFAESLALHDLTTGETVFESRATQFADRIGLKHVDYLSSVEGIPLYKSHEYELVSTYNNTSGTDQDSMALMYLYMLNKDFDRGRLKI